LILGAGATRGAIGHVVLNRKRLKPPLNADFFDVAATYARARRNSANRQVQRLRRVFKTELPLGRQLSLEEAFSLLYVAKDFPEVFSSRPGPRPSPGESSEIDDFLDLLFGVLHELDRQSNETGYDDLVSALEGGDSVLTLNYDTCLDSALHRAGWDPKTGYGLIGGHHKCKWLRRGVTSRDDLTDVKLLKLHGSLNWWVRSQGHRLPDVFSKKPALVTPPRGNDKVGHLRQIVPPIHGKFFSHSHWRHLWRSAFTALCSVERLVVIGCSIVETDFHLSAFLRRVAQRRKLSTPFREVILIGKKKVRNRWKRVLRGAVPTSAYDDTFTTFEGFLKKGL
jgi:hypothetical protein